MIASVCYPRTRSAQDLSAASHQAAYLALNSSVGEVLSGEETEVQSGFRPSYAVVWWESWAVTVDNQPEPREVG